jgi:uncharacterized membrane protein
VLALWPRWLTYIGRFIVIFHLVKRTDRTVLWLNLCVVFVPFPTALLGQYGRDRFAVMLYGAMLILLGLVLSLLWHHVTTREYGLGLAPAFVRAVMRRNLTPPLMYAVAVGAAFIDTRLSLVVYGLVPIFYMLPTKRIDPRIHRSSTA